jgi:hypothetical protein
VRQGGVFGCASDHSKPSAVLRPTHCCQLSSLRAGPLALPFGALKPHRRHTSWTLGPSIKNEPSMALLKPLNDQSPPTRSCPPRRPPRLLHAPPAAERTFLSWLNIAVLVMFTSLSLMSDRLAVFGSQPGAATMPLPDTAPGAPGPVNVSVQQAPIGCLPGGICQASQVGVCWRGEGRVRQGGSVGGANGALWVVRRDGFAGVCGGEDEDTAFLCHCARPSGVPPRPSELSETHTDRPGWLPDT